VPAKILEDIREGLIPLHIREYDPAELETRCAAKGFTTVESRRAAIGLAPARDAHTA
jgi:hypothetical protein